MPPLPPLTDDVRVSLPPEAQAYIAALEGYVASMPTLEARIDALAGQVAELEARLNQTSQNSSRPPSSDPPGAPPRPKQQSRSERKRGGQKGHVGHHRVLKTVEAVDRIEVHWPRACPQCYRTLPPISADGVAPLRQQVWELPEVTPTVTEHQYVAVCCPDCHRLVRATRPADVPPGAFGPRLVSLVGVLVGRYRLSHREVAALLAAAFGVSLSDGSITAACGQVSAALVEPYQMVHAEVEQAAHAHVDETGWKQAGQRRWLWVAVTTFVSLFRLASSRAGAELTPLLGSDYAGYITSDRFKAYLKVPIERRQVCWAHLKRDLVALSQAPYHSGEWGERALHVEAKIFALWHRFRTGEIDRPSLQIEMQPLRVQFAALLTEGLTLPWYKTQGFCADVQSLAPALWTFVDVEGIEPTNNAAERALRPAVLWRKGSFGSDSESGLRFVERILTVAATCRQQQRHLLTFLTEAVTAHWAGHPAPVLVATS